MIDIYGLDETAGTWRQKAAVLGADVVARHATDVDTNARFPSERMAALAQGGFYGLCTDSRQLGVERLFRDARAGWVMAPTVDHLADFIGRALTGLPLL
jgi:alkylation response protein AidB-like acyl-CoA dehydrogenase